MRDLPKTVNEMMAMNERVICNDCDYCMDVNEQVLKTGSYIAASSLVDERSLTCPNCGSDDLEDIDKEWAVYQLKTFAQYFGAWRGPASVNTKEARCWSKRLAEIADMVESEIE